MEVTDKEPYLIEGIRHSGEQTKGACLVPKRALNVMQGEVNRILQLTSNSVIPITYQVPRKTYRYLLLYPRPERKQKNWVLQFFQGFSRGLVSRHFVVRHGTNGIPVDPGEKYSIGQDELGSCQEGERGGADYGKLKLELLRLFLLSTNCD